MVFSCDGFGRRSEDRQRTRNVFFSIFYVHGFLRRMLIGFDGSGFFVVHGRKWLAAGNPGLKDTRPLGCLLLSGFSSPECVDSVTKQQRIQATLFISS